MPLSTYETEWGKEGGKSEWMSKLTHEQKRMLFDYCFGLTTETDTAQAKRLTLHNREAANLCALIKAALAPLDTLNPTPCPDSLAEKTVSVCCHPLQSASHLNNIVRAR